MSRANVDVVAGAYEDFSAGRVDEAIASRLHEDIRWTPSKLFPEQEVFLGHEGVRVYLARFSEIFEDFWMRPEELIEVGECQIMVPLKIGGVAGGANVVAEFVHVWTLLQGKVTSVETYRTLAEATKALAASRGPDLPEVRSLPRQGHAM